MTNPQYVYVLFHETNTGPAGDSAGYVEAVFLNESLAHMAKAACIQAAIAQGKAVYWDPIKEIETIAWTDDWRVETHTISTEPPDWVDDASLLESINA